MLTLLTASTTGCKAVSAITADPFTPEWWVILGQNGGIAVVLACLVCGFVLCMGLGHNYDDA